MQSPHGISTVGDQDAGDLAGSEDHRPPLFASGIAWIDRAYNVIRELRREHGLPDIRPLVNPSDHSEV